MLTSSTKNGATQPLIFASCITVKEEKGVICGLDHFVALYLLCHAPNRGTLHAG